MATARGTSTKLNALKRGVVALRRKCSDDCGNGLDPQVVRRLVLMPCTCGAKAHNLEITGILDLIEDVANYLKS
jgi:hypothetical protein